MHFSTTTLITALTLSTFTLAAPTEKRSCAAYPWFIVPYANSQSCSDGHPAEFQPTSGPYNAQATNTGCLPLYNPSGPPTGFESVAINRDPCPEQKWNIELYTDTACSGAPLVVSSDVCVPSPGLDAGTKWMTFKAVLAQN